MHVTRHRRGAQTPPAVQSPNNDVDRVRLASVRHIGEDELVQRPLPADLAAVLRRARQVELAAGTRAQLLDSVRATAVLALAAQREGWTTAELAAGLGLQHKTLRRRMHRYRHLSTDGLVVTPAPPVKIAPPPLPLEQRAWLTKREAMELAGLSHSGIEQWQRADLLPSTRGFGQGPFRFARTDIERVLDADERDGRGVRWVALRRRLNPSA